MYILFCQRPQAHHLPADVGESTFIICHRDIVGRNRYACGDGSEAVIWNADEHRGHRPVNDFLELMGPVTEPEGVHAVKNEARLPVPEIVKVENGIDHRRSVSRYRPADPAISIEDSRSHCVENIFFWHRALHRASWRSGAGAGGECRAGRWKAAE